jgi:hypothetical protein
MACGINLKISDWFNTKIQQDFNQSIELNIEILQDNECFDLLSVIYCMDYTICIQLEFVVFPQ